MRTKVFDEIQKKELASGSSKVDGTSKNRQASTEVCRFLLVTYSLFTLHFIKCDISRAGIQDSQHGLLSQAGSEAVNPVR